MISVPPTISKKTLRRAARTAALAATAAPLQTRRAPRPERITLPAPAKQTGMVNLGERPNGGRSGVAAGQLVDAFTKQDQAVLAYLETVAHPFNEETAGVPLVVGGFSLETDLFQMVYEGEAVAGTNGIAYVTVDLSGWVESGNAAAPQAQFESYAAGTQGNPIWASGNSLAGATGFPSPGQTATAIHVPTPSRIVDATWNANTRVRIVSAGLEVYSDAASQTATGKIMICSTVLPVESAGNGGLASTTFGQVVTTPKKIIERTESPAAGWKSGDVLRAFAVPAQQAAFELNTMPAVAAITVGFPIIGALGIGMATGQSFAWRVVYNFEAIADVSNKTSTSRLPVLHAGGERIGNTLPHLKPFLTAKGPAEAIASMPLAAHALISEMSDTRPSHASQLAASAKRPGLFDAIGSVASAALGKVAQGGWLKNIPIFGNALDTGAKFLSRWF